MEPSLILHYAHLHNVDLLFGGKESLHYWRWVSRGNSAGIWAQRCYRSNILQVPPWQHRLVSHPDVYSYPTVASFHMYVCMYLCRRIRELSKQAELFLWWTVEERKCSPSYGEYTSRKKWPIAQCKQVEICVCLYCVIWLNSQGCYPVYSSAYLCLGIQDPKDVYHSWLESTIPCVLHRRGRLVKCN